jgi:3-hydroxyisobutyrate dehydrogenase
MAQKLGLDPQTFYDIASVSSGQSWSVTSYCPLPGVGPTSPADNGYQGGFATGLMLKDLKLAIEAAKSVHSPVQLGQHALDIYQEHNEDGHGNDDFSSIMTTL